MSTKKTNRFRIWTVALALGAGLPVATPVFAAADGDKAVKKVDRENVPEKVQTALRERMGKDHKPATWYRHERPDRTFFSVDYETNDGAKKQLYAAPNGDALDPVALGLAPAPAVGAPAPLTPAPLTPAAPAAARRITPEQARAEIAQLNAQQQQLTARRQQVAAELETVARAQKDLDARARGGDRAAADQQAKLQQQRDLLFAEHERLGVEIARDDQRKLDAAAAGGLPATEAGAAGVAAAASGVIGAAAATGDKMLDDKDFKYAAVTADKVPPAVREKLAAFVRNGTDVKYRRELNGDKVSYSAHYVLENNKRYWASVNENGTVRVEPRLSEFQPDDDKARTAAAREPAAAAKLTPVAQKDVPKEVIQAITKAADKQGGHDWEFFKAGQDDYVVRYTTKDDKRMEARIDNSGKLVSEPHPVK